MITDTHAHLYWDSFQEDLDEVVKRAVEQGVTTVYNIGVDVETSQKALDQLAYLEQKGLTAYCSIGIHPHEAMKYFSNKAQVSPRSGGAGISNKLSKDIQRLEEIYRSNPKKVKFVGECGLDFYFKELDPSVASLPQDDIKNLQIALFQAQIDLAKKLNLPLSIHCRDDRSKDPNNTECWDRVIEMTKDHFGVYHCYSGLAQTTKRVLAETKFAISFAGNLTYPNNQYLRDAIKLIPEDRIAVETDCPFLPPQAHRGKRNEPSFIVDTVGLIAKLKSGV